MLLARGITLLVAWSVEEAATYLASLKQWGSKNENHDSSGFLGENKRSHTHSMRAVGALASACRLNERNSLAILKSYSNLKSVILIKDYRELLSFSGVGMSKIEILTCSIAHSDLQRRQLSERIVLAKTLARVLPHK